MRWIVLVALLTLSPLAAIAQASGDPAATPAYRLNPGDIVRISVWREDELLREARIQPDGTVSYPLVGSVPASGRTTAAIAEDIKTRLSQYIPDAVVTVELLDAQGYRVFVIGEVNQPGEFQLSQPITVLQALSIAGGLTPFAGTRGIKVLRTQDEPLYLDFDYRGVTRRGELDKNFYLQSGDTVIVPSSFF